MDRRRGVAGDGVSAAAAAFSGAAAVLISFSAAAAADRSIEPVSLDVRLWRALKGAGFTGRVGSTLEARLGRPVDPELAAIGNALFFDPVLGLRGDNACAGCHSPAHGFSDSQSIAIGVQNNGVVGAGRRGPRNRRRSPMVLNSAFYPKVMWNGRFRSLSGDPFRNSEGFAFPLPEGTVRFPALDPNVSHLLSAQAHLPSTELVEMAGFTGTGGPFDDGFGHPVPPPDAAGYRNEPIRKAVLALVNAAPGYRTAFAAVSPRVAQGDRITFAMLGAAIAEFEFSLTFADAPVDRFMRGDHAAMTDAQKRGALLFFGKAGCVRCHAVAGGANEMFSDFEMHVVAIPQIAPVFGPGTGNVRLAGPGEDEDFGFEEVTGDPADRYKFRTSPLRNIALQPAFFHNGAFTSLEEAIRHYNDPAESARGLRPGGQPPRSGPGGAPGPDRAGDRAPEPAARTEAADAAGVLGPGHLRARRAPRPAGLAGESASTRSVRAAERPAGARLRSRNALRGGGGPFRKENPMAAPRNRILLLAVALLGIQAAVRGEEVLYGGNGGHSNASSVNDGALVILDQVTAALTVVGQPAGIARLTGIAFASSGVLYASTLNAGGFPPPGPPNFSSLVTLDPDTGALLSTIGPIVEGPGGPQISISDIAFQPGTGVLFASRSPVDATGAGGLLYTIDTATAVATYVGVTGGSSPPSPSLRTARSTSRRRCRERRGRPTPRFGR